VEGTMEEKERYVKRRKNKDRKVAWGGIKSVLSREVENIPFGGIREYVW
jgi:hypothetical protein